MSTYATHYGTRETPQSEPIPGKPQVENSAGGFSFAVDDWSRLERFLILGSEGGSYYATERKLTVENAEVVRRCLESDGPRAVKVIVDVSENGRAPKNSPAIFALAMACGIGNGKAEALAAIPRVCRIGTHLFEFVECVKNFRGWGRALRKAVARWYTEKSPKDLAYQCTKYRQRNGWTHHDVLHKCHAKPPSQSHNYIFEWVKNGNTFSDSELAPIGYLTSLHRDDITAESAAALLREIDRPVREWVPTEFLNSPDVWDALLQDMPMTAMVRNLGKMSAIGLTKPLSKASTLVVDRLHDEERIRKSRIHPLSILVAQSIYRQGRGMRGSLNWQPDSRIIDALDDAFYLSFGNVEPTGKRWLLALDVSGSMAAKLSAAPLSCREASAAMAMVALRTEPVTHVVGFTGGGSMWNRTQEVENVSAVPLSKSQRLDDAVRAISGLPFGGTDCALPMLYAMHHNLDVDVFVVYTDNETWAGQIHPSQALQKYREKTGIPAKLIVVGMTANNVSIADPLDFGMMDVVGFDTAAPNVMADFARR